MRIFVDFGHPAHVHYFRNFIAKMTAKNHEIVCSARDKEMTHFLLDSHNINFFSRGKGSNTLWGKVFYTFKADFLLFRKLKKNIPDIFISFGSPYAAHVSAVFGKPHVTFDDTENAIVGRLMYRHFTDVILSPSCFKQKINERHLRFDSLMELCYLHPKYFTPNKQIKKILGLSEKESFTIIRFVSWNANHDIGHSGFTLENKIRAVKEFSKHSRVFISSENELPDELKKYSFPLPKNKMHDAMACAKMIFGESATMASESAVLGVPAIYLDNVGRGYTDELEKKYGLVYNFTESFSDQEKAIEKGLEILKSKNSEGTIWKNAQQKLFSEKIDVTAFMVWFIENYPESVKVMRENPDYQLRFMNNGLPKPSPASRNKNGLTQRTRRSQSAAEL